MRLKRLDIAPPGGFVVSVPETGASFQGPSFSLLLARLKGHLDGNGIKGRDAAEMIETQTINKLLKEGNTEWIH